LTTIIFLIVLMSMIFAKLMIQGLFLLHRLQLLGYYNLKFIKWLEGNQYRPMLLWNIFELLVPLLIILILYFNIKEIPVYKYITSSIMIITFAWKLVHPFISGWIGPKAYVKVPMKFTKRMIRLVSALAVVNIIVLIVVFFTTAMPFDNFTLSTWGFFQFNAFLLFISVITPVLVITANISNLPFERFIHFVYFKKAQGKLKKTNIRKIGITGSYGKTSTKFFLSTILSEKYRTLFTPASFNTPMGLSRVINDNIMSEYEVFVAEMGADHKGDIKVLCDLVSPGFGIITAIDIQHLETFGTLENIIETKISLFNDLPAEGFGIYNYDSLLLRENILKKKFKVPVLSYSIAENDTTNVNITAKDIKHTRNGLIFTAIFRTGEHVNIETELLGRHNASNLLAAVLAARLMGLSIAEIETGIKKIKPVEHRLQRILTPTGVLVLDDAFNANVKGSEEALNVLKEIEGRKKIIVTPGLIGLGEKEDEANYNFGKNISGSADIAILVGREKTKSIYLGLKESGFEEKNIFTAASLNEAQDILKNLVASQDVVLFENDLPDTFNE
jgi:UDP-N-acetylmuramoyl-tripeptide--D-alanyl-D-alanine ligase